jgi:hypothetical protein
MNCHPPLISIGFSFDLYLRPNLNQNASNNSISDCYYELIHAFLTAKKNNISYGLTQASFSILSKGLGASSSFLDIAKSHLFCYFSTNGVYIHGASKSKQCTSSQGHDPEMLIYQSGKQKAL